MSENKTWQQYRDGLEYQSKMGFASDFPSFEAFKEGEQWPQATERTRNLPRPVFNIVDMFIRTKRAAIINQPVTVQYSPAEYSIDPQAAALATQGAKDFSDYARQLWDACEQDELNGEFLDDAATLGTGVLHYCYDSSVVGRGDTPFVGEIRGETIDPLNIFFGDPQCRDEQRQPYIIIARRRSVDEIKAEAEAEGLDEQQIKLLAGDSHTSDEGYTAAKHELSGDKKITVLTKYYRKGGVVYFDRATEQVEIIKERCLTPESAPYQIRKYPIAIMHWYKRKKCIFGIGECQTLIPAQKAVNFLKAMELLSVQQTAWPKLIVKPNAINQPVTNEPGEMITDHFSNGVGITYLNPPVMTAAASGLAQSIFDLMRTVSGVNEATTGESMGSSMAASAIIALQSQAKKPIEEVQQHYWNALKRVGAVWEELIKAYYNAPRNITTESVTPLGEDEDPANQTRPFTGTAYANIPMKLKIDVGAASEYSEVLSQATLDNFLAQGFIDQFDYVELAPRNVVPFREQLKKIWEDKGAQQQAMMQQIMADMQNQTAGGMPSAPPADINDTPDGMTRPAGVGGVQLPAIPTAPGIPAIKRGG